MKILVSLSLGPGALRRGVIVACLAVGMASGVRGAAANRTLYWKGSTAGAATASNWCTDEELTEVADAAPVNGDAVVFTSGSGNMTWNLNDVAPGSWTQQAGYAGTVTFYTGKTNGVNATLYGWSDDAGESRYLKITGDCTLLGGTWTHAEQPSITSGDAKTSGEGVFRLIATIGGNLAVTNATITADGKGYWNGQGPGEFDTHAGGFHAGIGGRFTQHSSTFHQGPCYGTFRAPVTIGSGGGGGGGNDRLGGGSIQLTVEGAFLPGDTAVFTAIALRKDYYVGAGGSIFITAGTIVGGGSYSARGGWSIQGYGGGGGGGRIAFHVTDTGADFTGFTGSYTTHAQGQFPAGYGGTTYFETPADGAGGGLLVVDGVTADVSRIWKYGTTLTVADCAYAPKKIVLRDGAVLGVPADGTFSVKAVEVRDYVITNALTQLRLFGGTLAFPAAFTVPSNVQIHCWTESSAIKAGTGTGTLTLAPGARLKCDAASTLQGSLVVKSGAKAAHSQEWVVQAGVATLPRGRFDLAVTGDVTVEAGGEINVGGLGYETGSGPSPQGTSNRGGIHGGLAVGGSANRHCYGSIRRPTTYGGASSYTGGTGTGGGVVRLSVQGTLTNDGLIGADGLTTTGWTGAGGSVWLSTGFLSGSGVIRADGGYSKNTTYTGAGGRVAVWLTDPAATFGDYTGAIRAWGGSWAGKTVGASSGGGAGTVYLKAGAQAETNGTLVIASDGTGTGVTEIAAGGLDGMTVDVTDTEVGDVVIRDAGRLRVTNATLTVSGAWSNLTATAAVGGTVVFADASRTSEIAGTNEFFSLACVTPGKHLVFPPAAAGETRVSAGGVLKLVGDGESPVALSSLAEPEAWTFTVGAGASCELRYLDVNRSDAEDGITLVARDSAASEAKHNVNWSFPNIVPGMTNVWTGLKDRDWVNVENWSLGRTPVETDCVLVTGLVSAAGYPVLSGLPVTISNLMVRSGASLDLGGVDLTVLGYLHVSGALVARGTETLRCRGEVDLTGASVTSASSTIVFEGDGAWRVKTGGAEFWDVTATKGGGSLTFPDGLKATHDAFFGATAAWTADFAAKTVTCRRVTFAGAVGGVAALALTGTDWTLDALGDVSAAGVLVDHCTSAQATVYADAPSTDNGNNVNWKFGVPTCRWTGGSGNWSSANWSGGTPAATNRVVIETAATVTVDKAAEAGNLVVRGGGALKVSAALAVAGALEVGDGGTVTMNTTTPAEVAGGLVVRAGGTVTTVSQTALSLAVAGDAFVEEGGTVTALGLGYASQGETKNNVGVHGGRQLKTKGTSHCYGSIRRPVTFGRGGSWQQDGGSAGGGAIRLAVTGALRVDGTVTADGYGGKWGSGAGGSAWLTAGSLSGTGRISADGGYSPQHNVNHQPGGGGRVAVWLTDPEATFDSFSGTIRAWGGLSGSGSGTVSGSGGSGAGTVYLKTGAQEDNGGTLLIASDGSSCSYDTEICTGGMDGDVTDTDVGTVLVKDGARLLVSNVTVTVAGDWGPHSRAPVVKGTVAFADLTRTSHVYGTNTFLGFSCTEPGKRIEFSTLAGDVLNIAANGTFTLAGDEYDYVTLRGDAADADWRLVVDSTAKTSLSRVDVAHSDARGGQLLVARESTVSKNQDNQNWSFPSSVKPGEPISWTGANSSTWGDPENWDPIRVPTETDRVTVGPKANQPDLTNLSPILNSLTISPGASLALSGNALTVTNALRVAGTLVCSGSETVSVAGDVNFTGGTFTSVRSTLLLTGDLDQTLTSGGVPFWNVTAEKDGGTLTVADNLTADNFLTLTATNAWTVQFADGMTCACRRFDADGLVDDAAALTLAGPGWSLAVSAYAGVKGVCVSNSHATAREIYPSASVDLGGNTGWHFGEPATWTGTSGNFSDPTKWSTGEVPGETDHAVVPAGKAVTIDCERTVGSMDVFGTVTVTHPLTVAGPLAVLAGGAMTHPANNDAETYKLDLTVGGDLYVADAGKITTLGKGYKGTSGSTPAYGPPGAAGYSDNGYRAPSHGGRGDTYKNSLASTRCYGSIFRPTHIGAGGWSSGGGAAILKVSGAAIVDGTIDAQGDVTTHYAGAGGSVWLTCGMLSGHGTVSADSGDVTASGERYGSGGGRVAVYQTAARDWNAWTGLVSAYGSRSTVDGAHLGSAGTVYLQHAGQANGCGEVIVDNANGGRAYGTDLPPPVFCDDSARSLKQARIHLRKGAKLCVASDVKVYDVWMETANTDLVATEGVLSIRSFEHKDKAGWKGTVKEAVPGENVIWVKDPRFVFILK